jgi:hypothetical protein
MSEDEKELASIDYVNLVGGILNAIVEAQAKAALTTVEYIKDVAFDKENKVVEVNFDYEWLNDENKKEILKLTLPLITLLPIPDMTITSAAIEFNTKIASFNEHNEDLKKEAEENASAEKGENAFDFHVRIEAKSQDMPSGVERLLTILENSIFEKNNIIPGSPATGKNKIKATIKDFDDATKKIMITCIDGTKISSGATFTDDQAYTVITSTQVDTTDEWHLVVSCSNSLNPARNNVIEITI